MSVKLSQTLVENPSKERKSPPVPLISCQRVILDNISWQTFERLLTEMGENRGTRLAYDRGSLEIMTPLAPHEGRNRFLETLISAIAEELNLNLRKVGSLTLKRTNLQKGAEPDSCYYIQNEPLVRAKDNIDLDEDPPPDLVVEVDITSGSMDKLPIYREIGVPEFWRCQTQTIEVWVLNPTTKSYQLQDSSPTFPWLPINQIPRFIERRLIEGETATLKAFRTWIRELTKQA